MLRPSILVRPCVVLLIIASALLSGCAMVTVRSVPPADFVALKRGDIISTGRLSTNTSETLGVVGLDDAQCNATSTVCLEAVSASPALAPEQQLSALAELWLQQALGYTPEPSAHRPDARLHAWLEAARHAYAYLFFTDRPPGERAFEDRQIQMLDTYNYATQEAVSALFSFQRQQALAGSSPEAIARTIAGAGWALRADASALGLPAGTHSVTELLPATSLRFDGVRSTYRRDGFGAELVAVAPPDRHTGKPFSAMDSAAVTAILRFEGDDLPSVLATRRADIVVHNPYRDTSVTLHGHRVPLAANFTAGYGLWLARSGFSRQSIRALLGRDQALDAPHVYLMQPYDPSRRIILMIHGLASSPEAWVNLANEIMGDETLRRHFQVWQVYYPTNVPVTVNRAAIAAAVQQTLAAYDPDGTAAASCGMVVVGHSMGGLLSRLLASSSGDTLWQTFLRSRDLGEDEAKGYRQAMGPLVDFEPLPGVGRVIFLAAPHRGTTVAGSQIVHWLNQLVRLPLTVLNGVDNIVSHLAGQAGGADLRPARLSTGVDHLDANHVFVKAAANLPIQQSLPYHSIIARTNPQVDLPDSDDGLVPYWSSHLPDAISEIVITSGHSVQETPEAIVEIRRILHQDLAAAPVTPCD